MKIKCWVVYDNEFPSGMVYENRNEALESSREIREDFGRKAYTRVQYFTRQELSEMEEF